MRCAPIPPIGRVGGWGGGLFPYRNGAWVMMSGYTGCVGVGVEGRGGWEAGVVLSGTEMSVVPLYLAGFSSGVGRGDESKERAGGPDCAP